MNKTKNSKIVLVLSVFLIFLIIGSASAAEDTDEIGNETILTSTQTGVDTVSNAVDEEVSAADDMDDIVGSDDNTVEELQNKINNLKDNDEIILTQDYNLENASITSHAIYYYGTNGVKYSASSKSIFFITGNNITIDGGGHTLYYKTGEDLNVIFCVSSNTNFILKNINLVNVTAGVTLYNSTCANIINVNLTNFSSNGINVNDLSSNATIDYCNFNNATGRGIFSRGHGPNGSPIKDVWVLPTEYMKVTNCNFKNFKYYERGAGVEVNAGYSLIENCTFTNITTNYGRVGGAIDLYRSAIYSIVNNCTFTNCSAGSGGAIGVESNLCYGITIGNCTFINNTATGSGGGAIVFNAANSSISNCIFIGNHAIEGGAVRFTASNSYMGFSTYINNTATKDGGALCVNAQGSKVENCTFTNNTAPAGADFFAHGTYTIEFIGLKFSTLFLTNSNATYSVQDGYGTNVERPAGWRNDEMFLNNFLDTSSGHATIYPSLI